MMKYFSLFAAPFLFGAFLALVQFLPPFAPRCGVERWSVKTLTDAQHGAIIRTPVVSSVRELRGLPKPWSLPATTRLAPTELRTFTIRALIVGWKRESDHDFHIVVADSSDPTATMIVEVPDPSCIAANVDSLGDLLLVRRLVVARLGRPTAAFHHFDPPVKAKITGVGFFDFIHGQTGVAPNGIELHPVTAIIFEGP
jgi:hypothetical protein